MLKINNQPREPIINIAAPPGPHGGRVLEAASLLGLNIDQICDFSASLNPLGQPPGLIKHLKENLYLTQRYPDIYAQKLTLKIARYHDLDPECVWPGSGSSPQIYQLVRLLKPIRTVVAAPAFSEYAAAVKAMGFSRAKNVIAEEKNDFDFDLAAAQKLVRLKPDLVFIANPANPTGRLVSKEVLDYLIFSSRQKTGFFLAVDEAFIGFALSTQSSLLTRASKEKNLLVFRSLTKIFAIPGLRLGFLVTNPKLCAKFRFIAEPWALNALAQEAAFHCLEQEDFIRQTPLETARLKKILLSTLSPLAKTYISDANYVLIKLAQINHNSFIDFLFQKGVLVRDASNMPGLGKGFIRLAVRPLSEIKRLSQALGQYNARTS
jgi:threonine-phosphate decarboxylase